MNAVTEQPLSLRVRRSSELNRSKQIGLSIDAVVYNERREGPNEAQVRAGISAGSPSKLRGLGKRLSGLLRRRTGLWRDV